MKKKILVFVLLLLISIISFLPYLFIIQNYKLPNDTGYHYTITKEILQKENFVFWDEWTHGGYKNSYTPLFHLLATLLVLFGGLEIVQTFHILVAIALMIFPILTFILLKKFYNTKIALLSAFLLGISPVFLRLTYGKYPQMYAMLFIPLLILFLYEYFEHGKKMYLFLLSIFFSGLFLFHHLTGFITSISLLFIFLLYISKDKKNIKKIFIFIVICSALILPWLVSSFSYHLTTLESQVNENDLTLERFDNSISNILNIKSEIYTPLVVLIFGGYSLFLFIFKPKKNNKDYIFLIFLLVPLFFALSIYSRFYLQNHRFILYFVIFFLLIAGFGLTKIKRKSTLFISVLLLFLIVASVYANYDRTISLSYDPYHEEVLETLQEVEINATKYIPPEATVITDGYSRLALWLPGKLERKTIIVSRNNFFIGTPIYQRISDGQTILESDDLNDLENVLSKYPSGLYILRIKSVPRINFNFDWAFQPSYDKFYHDKDIKTRVVSEIVYSGQQIDVIKIGGKR